MWKDIGCTIIATRAATFDLLTNRYLADHPEATVLHVGCGMDSRLFRINPPASVQWFDVDYPDVIDLRRQLFPDRGAAYHLIGAQLEDLRCWMRFHEIVPGCLSPRGAALPERNGSESAPQCGGRSLPRRTGDLRYLQFVHCEKSGLERRGTGATYKWGLDDPQDIKQLEPKLELIKEFKPSEQVAV